MEAREVFHILQIEETRDKNQIKAAYRRLLVRVNPEDDPEGFKRLREAYETAIWLADQPGEEEQSRERDTSPVGLWVEQAAALYSSFEKRTCAARWQELLRDDLCRHWTRPTRRERSCWSF